MCKSEALRKQQEGWRRRANFSRAPLKIEVKMSESGHLLTTAVIYSKYTI